MKNDNPAILDLKILIKKTLIKYPQTEPELLTNILLNKIMGEFGGLRIYINRSFTENRNDQIKKLFNGTNYQQLAEQFGRSERTIRRIVDAKK